jgi:hypothetical protein
VLREFLLDTEIYIVLSALSRSYTLALLRNSVLFMFFFHFFFCSPSFQWTTCSGVIQTHKYALISIVDTKAYGKDINGRKVSHKASRRSYTMIHLFAWGREPIECSGPDDWSESKKLVLHPPTSGLCETQQFSTSRKRRAASPSTSRRWRLRTQVCELTTLVEMPWHTRRQVEEDGRREKEDWTRISGRVGPWLLFHMHWVGDSTVRIGMWDRD